ncbi:MAG: flagellar biosynthesis protein FlhB [Candidatus Margulisbacteria bacterium]|nr:flagellar biosynthesis protein FlhB [Candidatus Margulisiibacteriota bacterium]
MAEGGGDKSEEPTPHRLREAREKGQVAKSREITVAVVLLVSYYAFRYLGEFMWINLVQSAQALFGLIPEAKHFDLALASYSLLLALRGMAFVIGPIMGVVFLATFIAEALQSGFVFSGEPLSPKLEKLNPIEGFKKMFSMQGLVELIKSLLKIVIVFYIAWYAAKDDFPYIIALIESQPWDALALGGTIAFNIAVRVGYFYIAVAILDYLYRRWEYMRNLRMTRQEVKEEYKRLEGDPLVKQRMRDLQRQAAYQRMMGAVPQADVVVTNPIHIAVALKYEPHKMRAPKVLAKGERKVAEEIVRIAERHEITTVQNEPLARSIYRTTRLNQEVPSELYQAIAEVLAFVYKIKRDRAERKKASIALSRR